MKQASPDMNLVISILALLLVLPGTLDAQNANIENSKNAVRPSAASSETETLRVSGPQHVQDTMLRNGKFWGAWNYGNAPYLQVGVQPSTVYDIYRSVSLVRFDLAGLSRAQVQSAKLRLYVPRNQTQIKPVPLHIHVVNIANARWQEGSSEAQPEAGAASWNQRADGKPWAGAPGCGRSGADYEAAPLDSQTADGLEGRWLEFQLPPALVESWMEQPDRNAGLLIRTDDDAEPGEGTHICSSQHWSGNGPQLVITGKLSPEKVPASVHTQTHYNRPYQLPPTGPLFERWLNESDQKNDRYPVWARDKSINLIGEQRIFPYLWDITVKADILIPKATLPLSQVTEELPAVIARGDRPRAHQIMEDCMRYLMVYDYGRDQIWYDSGPTADILSPLQVAKFFVKDRDSDKGGAHPIYSQYDDGRWGETSPEQAKTELNAQLEEIKKQLKPTPAQFAAIEPVIATNMALERQHRAELKKYLQRVQELMRQGNDGPEMLLALRGMFFHHRMFLIHQSLFSMPKYNALLENGDILGYAQWFYKKRVGQYNHERVGRQLAAATRYLWRPSPYCEAEYAAFEGCEWSNKTPGFNGTGYVVFDDRPGSHIEWETKVAVGGKHNLVFRYFLAGANNARLQLSIDGTPQKENVSFSPTGAGIWATRNVAVNLPAGLAKIRLTALGDAALSLDYLDVQPSPMAGGEGSRRRTTSSADKSALAGSAAE
jgi:DNA-binding transcriptional MerR regulator